MKKLLILALTAFALTATAQQWNGRWWLANSKTANMPVNIRISESADSTQVLFYSPLQSHEAVTGTTTRHGDTLLFSNKTYGISLRLAYHPEDSTFDGLMQQRTLKERMLFRPADTLFSYIRPQKPQRPLPYLEEEVKVEIKHTGVTLTGTLTMPKDAKGKVPAVVLVSGSGQQNRNSEIFGHEPFEVIADYLTRKGIAVLRYDDRGVGGSTGEVATATTMDFAGDAEAMFEYLCRHKGIDRRRVGIVGHSEGGDIAPIVASRNRKVAMIVMLAGPGCSGKEILAQQNRALLSAQGMADSLIDGRVAYLEALLDGDSNADRQLRQYSKEQRLAMGLNKGTILALKQQTQIPWMQAFARLDPKDYLEKVRCPILAVNGDKDCQVVARYNLPRIKQYAPQAETHLMPGLNHLMQHATSGLPEEYMTIEETFSPEVLEMMANFILTH